MDAANMLKPALARGELHCIGATTLDEYRKHIEKDAALERRFQPVFVGEPTVEDTISILRGLKERYEVHHRRADHRFRARGGGAVVESLHHRPVFAGQGDRLDGRSGVAAAHADGTKPDELDAIDRKIMQIADRARGLAKGKGRGVQGSARTARKEIRGA